MENTTKALVTAIRAFTADKKFETGSRVWVAEAVKGQRAGVIEDIEWKKQLAFVKYDDGMCSSVHFLNCWASEKECSDAEECRKQILDRLSGIDIVVLGLRNLIRNTLKRNGVMTMLDLLKVSDARQLAELNKMGGKTVEETLNILNRFVRHNFNITTNNLREICFPHGAGNMSEGDITLHDIDNYEAFYRAIFKAGYSNMLPSNYKEAVLYTIENIGMPARDVQVAARYFGIGEYDKSETVKKIGMDLGMSASNVTRIINKCIRKCSCDPWYSFLATGHMVEEAVQKEVVWEEKIREIPEMKDTEIFHLFQQATRISDDEVRDFRLCHDPYERRSTPVTQNALMVRLKGNGSLVYFPDIDIKGNYIPRDWPCDKDDDTVWYIDENGELCSGIVYALCEDPNDHTLMEDKVGHVWYGPSISECYPSKAECLKAKQEKEKAL